MNTLIYIVLPIQQRRARHTPTVELRCLSWERPCVPTTPCAPGNMHVHIHNNKNHYNLCAHFTQLIPDLLINTRRELSHSTLYKTDTHTHTHSSLSHNPSPGLDFTTQTASLCLSLLFPFLPRFSLCFHGSVERAITSASVWRPGDEELCGCEQTPGHG